MVVNTTFDKLPEELQKQLENFSTKLNDELKAVYKNLAEAGANELKQGRPYHNRTGQYAKDFGVTQRKSGKTVTGAESYTIYNKKHYQLTHLLEHGHLTRSGSRTAAFKHWEPTLEHIEKAFEREVEKAIRNASD